MMKTRSRKTKGKRGQNVARKYLVEFFKKYGLTEADFIGVPAGVPGSDILLSSKARKLFDYDIEVKNQERLNIWDAILQSRKRLNGDKKSIVFFTRNREKMYATLEMTNFLELLDGYLTHTYLAKAIIANETEN